MSVRDPEGSEAAANPWKAHWSRRMGYRIFPGDGYAYLLHMRPREWPIVAAHAFFGFLIAIPEAAEVSGRWPNAVLGVALFVILLNGGTLAINSAFDRDSGDVGYLDAPPPPPRHLFAFGMALMLSGLLVSSILLPLTFSAVYAACVALSVLYSVPPFRWKAIGGLDLAINAIGFGVLTAAAGWTLADVPLQVWSFAVLVGFGPLFAGLYPLTQLYQMEEDRDRGDRTLAIVLGPRGSLVFALSATVIAFAFVGLGLFARPGQTASWCLLLPFGAWLLLLLRWLARHTTMSAADHKAGMYRALRAWALTNFAVLAAIFGPLYF